MAVPAPARSITGYDPGNSFDFGSIVDVAMKYITGFKQSDPSPLPTVVNSQRLQQPWPETRTHDRHV